MRTGENGSQNRDEGGRSALLDSSLEKVGGLEENSTGKTRGQACEEVEGGMGLLGAWASIGHDLEQSRAIVDGLLVIKVGEMELVYVVGRTLTARAWLLTL